MVSYIKPRCHSLRMTVKRNHSNHSLGFPLSRRQLRKLIQKLNGILLCLCQARFIGMIRPSTMTGFSFTTLNTILHRTRKVQHQSHRRIWVCGRQFLYILVRLYLQGNIKYIFTISRLHSLAHFHNDPVFSKFPGIVLFPILVIVNCSARIYNLTRFILASTTIVRRRHRAHRQNGEGHGQDHQHGQ